MQADPPRSRRCRALVLATMLAAGLITPAAGDVAAHPAPPAARDGHDAASPAPSTITLQAAADVATARSLGTVRDQAARVDAREQLLAWAQASTSRTAAPVLELEPVEEPTAREVIAAGCPDIMDPDVLRNGADADGRGLCERSVHEARTDASAAAIVEGFHRLGLPYSRGRRSQDGYDDCSSFVSTSYRNAGFPLSDTDWLPSSSAMRNAAWAEVVDEPLPGDILWRRGHVAMALADGYQMHASQSGDVTHVRAVGRYSRVLAVQVDALSVPAPAVVGPDTVSTVTPSVG